MGWLTLQASPRAAWLAPTHPTGSAGPAGPTSLGGPLSLAPGLGVCPSALRSGHLTPNRRGPTLAGPEAIGSVTYLVVPHRRPWELLGPFRAPHQPAQAWEGAHRPPLCRTVPPSVHLRCAVVSQGGPSAWRSLLRRTGPLSPLLPSFSPLPDCAPGRTGPLGCLFAFLPSVISPTAHRPLGQKEGLPLCGVFLSPGRGFLRALLPEWLRGK